MKNTIAIITTILLFGTIHLQAQIEVYKVGRDAIDPSLDGFFYSLPKTGIRVDVEVKKTQKIKGPYAEFADKYLGLSQVVTLNSTEYEVSSIQLSTFTGPDPDEFYFVKSSSGKKDRQVLELFLSENGALVGAERISAAQPDNSEKSSNKSSGIHIPEVPNPTMFERVDTVIRRISVDTTTIEQKVFKKISSAKTADQKAKEAADFILKLDESMFNLINGYQEVSYEKGTMEYMYKQMDELKNEYLQLFKGVTGVSTESYSFTFFPERDITSPTVTLARFSISKGMMDKNLNGGDQVQLEMKALDHLSQIKSLAAQRNTMAKEKGFYYCIPEDVLVSVKLGGQVKVEGQFKVNQLGVVTYLPSSAIENLEIYNNTGGIKHVTIR